jgi:HD superfamily phosphohydrolase
MRGIGHSGGLELAKRDIRDPVHGFITIDDTECEIIDSGPFQRLRGIHQLALARQLYPGATHSRFEHSLGVYHIASRMCEQLGIGGDDRRRVRQAALLHDIGHGPFSHVSEAPLARYASQEMLDRARGNPSIIHELVTCDIVTKHPALAGIEGLLRTDVSKLILDEYGDRLMKAVLSGPLDADKQDYLLRDSLMCGVRYGVFDIDQLRLCLTSRDDGDGRTLMLTRDGVHTVEQFVMAKYYITWQVYAHRVRLITDQMLTRAITLGVDVDGIEELRKLYAYDGSEEFVRRYVEWDDWRLLQTFTDALYEGKWCHRLLSRLKSRRLFKLVFERPLREFDGPVADALARLGADEELDRRLREGAAELISSETGQQLDPFCVIFYVYTVRSVRAESPGEIGEILVDRGAGPPVPFHQESTLFRSIDESEADYLVNVFAPVEYSTDEEKRQLLDNLADRITDLIAQTVYATTKGESNDGAA